MNLRKERHEYNKFFIRNAYHVLMYKIFHKIKKVNKFLDKKNITLESSTKILIDKLNTDKPFCAIRFGAVELSCWNNYRKIELNKKKIYKDSVNYSIKNNAGVFPVNYETLSSYSKLSLEKLALVDTLAISGIHMEDYFAKHYMNKDIDIIQNWACEPLLGNYTKCLENKNVLVISPFSEDIEKQYKNKDKLFIDKSILPNFNLITIKAPLTQGEEEIKDYESWFKALEEMKEKMRNIDFDILLVGAGAYGMHLAIYAKELGKKAIQSGGATQTLFGIIGKRWENREHVKKHINEYWIRPSLTVKNNKTIENGAYW